MPGLVDEDPDNDDDDDDGDDDDDENANANSSRPRRRRGGRVPIDDVPRRDVTDMPDEDEAKVMEEFRKAKTGRRQRGLGKAGKIFRTRVRMTKTSL